AEDLRRQELSWRVYGIDIEQGGARSGPGLHAADASAQRTWRLPWTSRGHLSCAEDLRRQELSWRVYGIDIEQGRGPIWPWAACGRCIRPAHLAPAVDVEGPSVTRRGSPSPGIELESPWSPY
ncbi:unnamed protein product, partial [Mycena citricolor]